MNVEKIREDFHILKKGIIYFDSACMSLRPKQVIDKINEYYTEYPACAGRSIHKLGNKVEDEVDDARNVIKKFIGAKKSKEIIFTKNATESINLLANSFKFDKVLLTDREHNSNLLPWQTKKYGIFKVNNGFNIEKFSEIVKDYDFVSFVFTSNLDGYTIPAKEIVKIAHEEGAKVHLDAAQTIPHQEVNVRKLDADFISFSGHKMLGPSGMGVLYGKEELLEKMDQFIIGGETVVNSTYDSFEIEKLPNKFEAGLQNYAGIIGLGEAAKYLSKIGLNEVHDHEIKLVKAIDTEGLKVVGIPGGGIFNFNIPGVNYHEVASILDASKNIMIRSGAHCVHSWYNANSIGGSCRASFYLYNTLDEIRVLNEELEKLKKLG
ncbi:aminotransferase class V-fold PLP-dependent enzyme [archaeon]|nr:aminotransferase class V-fold PLP-dependent enzyme [archaeon]